VRAYPQATTTYFVTGTDAQGCSTTDSITITRDPWQPVYAITPAAGGNPFAFNFSDSSPGSVSWQWNFGDGSFSFNQNPSHTYNGPGTYHVSLFVSNGNCTVILNDTLQLASVGLPDALQSQVLLYPNPTTGLVNVALPAVYNILSLKVFDAQGRLLPSTAALIEGNKANVNLDGLPSGIYWILVASTSHEQAYLRIVKQ
jgi:hypothetical protein